MQINEILHRVTARNSSRACTSKPEKKPLPVPQERPKQHRAGNRIRAAKKKYEMTEVRKYMNRVPFGVEEEEEYRDTGHTFGMLG